MQSGLIIAVLVAAAVVSLFFPTAGVWLLLLLFPVQIIAGRRAARASQAPTAP